MDVMDNGCMSTSGISTAKRQACVKVQRYKIAFLTFDVFERTNVDSRICIQCSRPTLHKCHTRFRVLENQSFYFPGPRALMKVGALVAFSQALSTRLPTLFYYALGRSGKLLFGTST